MIKNIVFDMGGVLIRFDTHYFISRLGVSQEDESLLMREVFRSVEWIRMDRGTLTDDEASVIICSRIPQHLRDTADKLIHMWERPILPIEGMEELIRDLHNSGYRIYLLSNASYRQHEYWPRVSVSQYFDDTLISADHKVIKPQPEIFAAAFKKFGILPEESLFADDSPMNIEASENAGMEGFVFNGDAEALREWLIRKGVRIQREKME